jgi:hypothetical protein
MTGNIVAVLSFGLHSHSEGCKEALPVFLSPHERHAAHFEGPFNGVSDRD